MHCDDCGQYYNFLFVYCYSVLIEKHPFPIRLVFFVRKFMVDMNICQRANVCPTSIQFNTCSIEWIAVVCVFFFSFVVQIHIDFHFLIIIIDIHMSRNSLCFPAIFGVLRLYNFQLRFWFMPIDRRAYKLWCKKIKRCICTPNKINGAWHKPYSCIHIKYHFNCLSNKQRATQKSKVKQQKQKRMKRRKKKKIVENKKCRFACDANDSSRLMAIYLFFRLFVSF